jgi:hypothetical protein
MRIIKYLDVMVENKRDITPHNQRGQSHGYTKVFHNNLLLYEGNYVNNKAQGMWKEYWDSQGKLTHKIFYI